MPGLFNKINYVDCFLVEQEESMLLILTSKHQKVFNPIFTIGIICFVASMIFKANIDADIAAIPLAISTLILMAGVWRLSGTGKIVFNKKDGQVYCIYNHFGYLRKIYVHSIKAIEAIELHGNKLEMIKDNGERILIARVSPDVNNAEELRRKINSFITV